ncbi:MAG TPA: hypothetical protein VNT20_18300 [Flavisolibacter sp.]|jgi:predicted DNA-binding transcriptional regulator AlpA|nr:hypothetical protein [Flavisolibacter sp.]
MYQQPTDLIRIREASKMVGLSTSYIYKLSSQWWIPLIKKKNELWFSISELKEFNEGRKTKKRNSN